MNLTAAGSTHVGLVRKKNEDSFFCENEDGVYAVADGFSISSFGRMHDAVTTGKALIGKCS
jgi:serine/threonine protein phosphatase PrpC